MMENYNNFWEIWDNNSNQNVSVFNIERFTYPTPLGNQPYEEGEVIVNEPITYRGIEVGHAFVRYTNNKYQVRGSLDDDMIRYYDSIGAYDETDSLVEFGGSYRADDLREALGAINLMEYSIKCLGQKYIRATGLEPYLEEPEENLDYEAYFGEEEEEDDSDYELNEYERENSHNNEEDYDINDFEEI